MNRREAKRFACWRAARILDETLWALDLSQWVESEADQERVLEAMRELIRELERRGWA